MTAVSRVRAPEAKNGIRTASGELSMAEQNRRHLEAMDAQPMVTRCGLGDCEWLFDGSAGAGRAAAAEHRRVAHPDLATTSRRRGPAKPRGSDAELLQDVVEALPEAAGGIHPNEEVLGAEPAVGDMAGSGSAEAVGEPERAGSAPSTVVDEFEARRRRRKPWAAQEILVAFRRFHTEHGRWPLVSDVNGTPYLPNPKGLRKSPHGSWQAVWDALGAGPVPTGHAAHRYRTGGQLRSSSWPVAEIVGGEPKGPAGVTAESGELTVLPETPVAPSPVASPDPSVAAGEAGSPPAPLPAVRPVELDELVIDPDRMAGWRETLLAEAARCEQRAEGYRIIAEGLAILEDAA